MLIQNALEIRLAQDLAQSRIATVGRVAKLKALRRLGGRGSRDGETPMRVRDVMTYGAIGVLESATLAEAVETLLGSRVSALLVFDPKHRLVGVLSEGDLLRRAELGTDSGRPHWLEFLLNGGRLADAYTQTHGRVVSEIMTSNVKTISEAADLREAVDLMLRANVKRLPVLRSRCGRGHLALRSAQGSARLLAQTKR